MVSVAMVAYNQQDVIEQAILGVVNQQADFPVELIIADDASTDRTHQILLEWQQKYPHIIKVIRNESNVGLQRNYFVAFAHCRGKYLALCDGDDYWCDSNKLARQVAYMEAHPECALTFHRVINLFEHNGSKSFSNGGQKVDCDVSDLSRSNFITNLSVVYRADCVDLGSLPSWFVENNPLPDYALHLLFASHGTIHYFKRPMGVYRIRKTATWSLARQYEKLRMALTVRDCIMEYLDNDPRIVPGLQAGSKAILLSMMRNAGNDEALLAYPRERLLRYPEFPDQAAITRALAAPLPAKPLHRRLLTAARTHLSRLLPIPGPAR